jgi:hypothetical protein
VKSVTTIEVKGKIQDSHIEAYKSSNAYENFGEPSSITQKSVINHITHRHSVTLQENMRYR